MLRRSHAVVALALLARGSAHAGPPCTPGVELSGDAATVAAVAARLAALGVATRPVTGCPAVHARVEGDAVLRTIFITVGELARGFEYLTVSDAGVAASWIGGRLRRSSPAQIPGAGDGTSRP